MSVARDQLFWVRAVAKFQKLNIHVYANVIIITIIITIIGPYFDNAHHIPQVRGYSGMHMGLPIVLPLDAYLDFGFYFIFLRDFISLEHLNVVFLKKEETLKMGRILY